MELEPRPPRKKAELWGCGEAGSAAVMLAGQDAGGYPSPFLGLVAGSLQHLHVRKPQGEAGRGVEGRAQLRLTVQRQRDTSECLGAAVAKRQLDTMERYSVPSRRPEGRSQGVSRATALQIEALSRVPPASSSSWGPQALLGLWTHPCSLCLHPHTAFFVYCVSESRSLSSCKDGLGPTLAHTPHTHSNQSRWAHCWSREIVA